MPFANFPRTDVTPRRALESSFRFLDRSARPEIARVRAFLQEAIRRYPAAERDDVIARLRSENEVHFRSASFEVLLHEGLSRLGFILTVHPEPGTGVAKRPDFRVRTVDGIEFFLEAVLAGVRDGRNPASEAIKNSIIGLLDAAPHAGFLLDVQSDGDPLTQPSGRNFVRQVHEWLNTLDQDHCRSVILESGLDQMPTLLWTHEDWELSLRAIPLPPARRGKATRLLGAQGDGVRRVNAWEPLRNAVKKKANRYGQVTKPLVVAVNADNVDLDEIDEEQALYGEEQWVEVIGHAGKGGLQRIANGAWRGPDGPQCRKVSGVWFFNDLTPYTLATRRSTLYLNPWAHLPTPPALDCLPTRRLVNETLVRARGITPRAMFGVNPEWPE
jgi:hypothetical protein